MGNNINSSPHAAWRCSLPVCSALHVPYLQCCDTAVSVASLKPAVLVIHCLASAVIRGEGVKQLASALPSSGTMRKRQLYHDSSRPITLSTASPIRMSRLLPKPISSCLPRSTGLFELLELSSTIATSCNHVRERYQDRIGFTRTQPCQLPE